MPTSLTDLPGVGQKTAERLRRYGFDTVEDIKNAEAWRLARVRGISRSGARDMINAAGGEALTWQEKKEKEREEMYGETYKRIDRTSPNELAEIVRAGPSDYTGGEVKERHRGGEDYPSQWNLETVGPRRRTIERIEAARSQRAQDADLRQNAPVTTDEEKWIEHPNRYDYPGVDTIPEERINRRAEAAAAFALDHGFVDRVEQKGTAKRNQGKFSPRGSSTYGHGVNVARVQKTADEPGKTLAHEVSHAIDYSFDEGKRYGLASALFEQREGEGPSRRTLEEEALEISKKSRGDWRPGSSHGNYRRGHDELLADFLGSAFIQPRATRRDAPHLWERLEELGAEGGFLEAIPEPLGRDPERQGILSY